MGTQMAMLLEPDLWNAGHVANSVLAYALSESILMMPVSVRLCAFLVWNTRTLAPSTHAVGWVVEFSNNARLRSVAEQVSEFTSRRAFGSRMNARPPALSMRS